MLHGNHEWLDPEEENPETKTRSQARKLRAKKIPRSGESYVKVHLSWFVAGRRPYPFGQRERLFLLLLHLSRFGTRPVVLTSATVEELGLSRKERWRYLQRLEADGWVCIERNGHKSARVYMLNLSD